VTGTAYLDASAIVKLVVQEAESDAFHRWYVESRRLLTSRIGVVETLRAAARVVHDRAHLARIITDLEICEFTPEIAAVASSVGGPSLRTLDAIHVATALTMAPELSAFVTYDDRMADAARGLGLPVVRPA
jgi:predicted nucleic acid-binding protein